MPPGPAAAPPSGAVENTTKNPKRRPTKDAAPTLSNIAAHMDTRLIVQRIHPDAQLPRKANPTDACHDLFAVEETSVPPAATAALATGLAMQIEAGWEVQVRGRSGLARKGIVVHFGTIDHLYRLEVKVLVRNTGAEPWHVQKGDRIAQIKLARVYDVEVLEGEVENTERGGFGSTGT